MVAIIGLVLVLLGILALAHVLAVSSTVAIIFLVIGVVLIAFEYGPRLPRR